MIAFLANQFPAWKRRWEVSLTPRLEALIGQCQVIAPKIEITPHASGEDWLGLTTEFRSGRRLGRAQSRRGPAASPDRPQPQAAPLGQDRIDPGPGDRGMAGGADRLRRGSRARLDPRQSPLRSLSGGSLARKRAVAGSPADFFGQRSSPAPAPPPELETVLRPYQKEGVAWLHALAAGGIGRNPGRRDGPRGKRCKSSPISPPAAKKAADDPKRIPSSTPAPCLVVAPTSLLINWQREAERFTPGLKTAVPPRRGAARLLGSSRGIRPPHHLLCPAAPRRGTVPRGDFRGRRPRRGAAHQEPFQPKRPGRQGTPRRDPDHPDRHAARKQPARSLVDVRFPDARLPRPGQIVPRPGTRSPSPKATTLPP